MCGELPSLSSFVFGCYYAFVLFLNKSDWWRLLCLFQASGFLKKLSEPGESLQALLPSSDLTSSVSDEIRKADASNYLHLADYSSLFGEELKIPDDQWDSSYANVLDISTVEEGILHVLHACASQVSYDLRDVLLRNLKYPTQF